MRLLLLFNLIFIVFAAAAPSTEGHNITLILTQHPDFSIFNNYLSLTRLASEINRRQTITVLAVNNGAMSSVVAKHLSLQTLKNLLSLHVLVDYFGDEKLHNLTGGTTLASTIFQSTGDAPGTTGFVNITDHRAGVVSFTPDGSHVNSSFVKFIKELPYNISVVQINSPLSSPVAEAPTPSPSQIDFIDIMSKKGCKTFAYLITAGDGAVAKAFKDNVDSGLTVFCPLDQALGAFAPKFNKLTAPQKVLFMLYHGMPSYESMDMLRSDEGVKRTLATQGKSMGYNFMVHNVGKLVTLKTRLTTASVTGTLVDEEPLAVYTIDEVLEPVELFNPGKAPKAPAPSPSSIPPVAVEAPKGGDKKKDKHGTPPALAPAGPEEQPADDEAADKNAGEPSVYLQLWVAVLGAALAVIMVA